MLARGIKGRLVCHSITAMLSCGRGKNDNNKENVPKEVQIASGDRGMHACSICPVRKKNTLCIRRQGNKRIMSRNIQPLKLAHIVGQRYKSMSDGGGGNDQVRKINGLPIC